MEPLAFFLIYLAAISLLDFAAYGIDKNKARKGRRRISEKTLLSLGALGGAFGGLLGMKFFHHKTKHRYFWVINFISLAAHIAIIITLLRI